ncbi:putative histidine kinase response regulator [Phytohabitans rumicis]|uniref:Putative histidine kinase response regulator n=1 Tax=Phytohabitans rumicis TaxID=1076125 RepID=A0A6V8KXF3_9ACTN|nr:GAF domain-containing sensor histidine kinase [Phytohabitans rumicis]GFJ86989.1 putative histidine kinase response regulator [Phytohabitans rumicis]
MPSQHEEPWASPSLGLSPLSRVRLDELLQELLDRVGVVVASRERLRALLDAVVGIGGDLELRSMLTRIVEAACALVGARYGALGVIGHDRTLVEFITHGISPQVHAQIGDLPHGRGVLGLLIQDPRPVRMPDITKHPQSYGFPPNHPPMHSFLGAPIRIRDQVFGNLYLAEKQDAAEFTDDDEEIVVALAAAAGVAIENARLYATAHRRERWMAATAEITNVLLGQVDRTAALRLVARRAREVAEAQLVLVMLADEEAGHLTVEVVDAGDTPAPDLAGTVVPLADTAFADAISGAGHVVIDDLGKAAAWPAPISTGSTLITPLAAAETLHGLLVVALPPGASSQPEDVPMLHTFADQAALALERARAQDEREQLVVLEDRERIARDLHDVVIQRLFATGLHLQTTAQLAARPDVAQRISGAIDDLDTTIRDIRTAIFELRTPVSAALRTEIRDLVAEAAGPLGFRPELRLSGPVDSAVPDHLRPDLLAVIREALSNAARHARATAVKVTVTAVDGRLTVTVADNGVGAVGAEPHGGLINLRERAAQYGGEFEVRPAEPAGTEIRWSVPI